MSEYPPGSTAKVYYDIDSKETTLYRMVRSEPDWAQSRIVEGEKAIAELIQALKDLQAICDAPNARAEKAESRVKELDKELYLETVKNKSSEARVEFLEDKWSEWTEPDPAWFDLSFKDYARLMKAGREKAEAERDELFRKWSKGASVALKDAVADSKRYRVALEKIATKDYRPSCHNHLANRQYCIAEQALIDTESEKGGA
jgi:hypothetical protein